MPSPDLLPKGRTFPTVSPPALDVVVDKAVRRRRVRAVAVGTVCAGVSVIAGLLLTTGTSANSLKVVTPAVGPSASARPSVAPTLEAIGGDPSAHPPQHRQPPAGTQPYAVAAATPSGPSGQAPPLREGPGIIGPPHRMVRYDATRGCNGTGPTAASGWCSYYDGATSGTAGQVVELATAVCRLPSAGSGTLVADDGRQADFDVGVDAYPASWTWSHAERFARGTTSVAVAAGSCVEWYVTWNVADDAGRPLHAGTYYLDATPLAQPSNANASATAYNPQRFTVH
jgi:hypothetical protein